MAQAYPDGTLIGIIIMAILILALLWRDKISDRNPPEPSPSPDERDPGIHAHHRGDDEIGESFWVEGSYSTGSADDFDIEASLNGSAVQVEASNGNFRTQEVNVREQNEYRVEITTPVGSDYDEGSFPGQEESPKPPDEESPRVSVTREQINDEEGAFDLLAEAEPGSSEIQATGFVKMLHVESGRGFDYEDRPEESRYLEPGRAFEYNDSGKPPGTYYYTAWTIDAEGRTDTYADSFTIEPPQDRIGGTGGQGGQPLIIYNPQVLEERSGNLPPEFIQAIEALAESIRESGDEEIAVEIGEELEGLVAAVEALGDELEGPDVQQLVQEIRTLVQEVESGSVDVSGLERQIEELIETLEEQSGLSDEEREFYARIEEKIDELIEEAGGGSELEELEGLIDLTINPEASVEVSGLSAEDRMMMRRILQEVRSRGVSRRELMWLMQEYVRQRRNQGQIFMALQAIWMELQESGDPEAEENYYGGNWEVFLEILEESDLEEDFKESLIDVLRGMWNYYPVSARWVVRIRKHVENIDEDDVPETAERVIDFTRSKNLSRVDDDYLKSVLYILRENFTPDENFLSMREKQQNMAIGHEPSYSQGEIHDFLQQTHETLEEQHQKAERVAQLDERAIQDIEEAMQDFEKERAIIQALADIPHDEFQEALQEGNQVAIQDMLDTAAKRAEIPNAFGDEQYIQNLHQDLQEMEEDIREAHNILQTADELMEDEVDHDLDLEQAMETFEASYIDQLEGALNILEQYLNS